METTIEAEGLRLGCPSGWVPSTDLPGAAIALVRASADLASGGFATNVALTVAEGGVSGDGQQLEAFFMTAFDALGAELPEATMIDFTACELIGRPARRLVATYFHDGRGLTLDQWLVPREGDHLVVSGTARNREYPQAIAAFEAIATSLEEVGA